MVANKYAFLQITRRRFLNEWEAFKKVISRRNIRRRITVPLTISNLKLLRRITRTETILHRNFTRRFFFNDTATTEIYTLSLHDALPISVFCTVPNAPNRTLANDRFIARHMMIERIKPLEPSRAPAVTRSLLSSTKPIATAERPA